jgi:hypothetical protein
MKLKHRYTFRIDRNNIKIISFLDKYNIKYETSSGIPLTTVEVLDSEDYWEDLDKLMCHQGIVPIIEKIFTTNEMKNATWSRIRSKWRWGYPQPQDESVHKMITYDNSNYCNKCGYGLVQKGNFMVKATPNWKNKHFLMLNWIEDELFITNEAKMKLEKSDLNGFRIRPVNNYTTGQALENMHQIEIAKNLDILLIFNQEDIYKENYCKQCNSRKYILSGKSILKAKKSLINDSCDIIKTKEKFGDGLVCMSNILISQKMYMFLKEKGLEKDLVFEPIELVD